MATLRKFIGLNCAKYLNILGIKLNQIDENRSEFERLLSEQKRKLAKIYHPDVNKDGLNDMQKVSHFVIIFQLLLFYNYCKLFSIKSEFY